MSGELSALVTSLSATFTVAKAFVAERDGQKQAELKAELTEQILDGQAKLAQAIAMAFEKDATINELRARLQELEVKGAEKARYRLAKLGSVGEFFAYQLRPPAELAERGDEPEHFLCQPCFDAGKKSVLHIAHGIAMCPVCGRNARIEPAKPSAPRVRHSVRADFSR